LSCAQITLSRRFFPSPISCSLTTSRATWAGRAACDGLFVQGMICFWSSIKAGCSSQTAVSIFALRARGWRARFSTRLGFRKVYEGSKIMKTQFLFTGIVFLFVTASAFAQTTAINFDKHKVGEAPKGFTTALTGRGKSGVWVVTKD